MSENKSRFIEIPAGFALKRNQILFIDKNAMTLVEKLFINMGKKVDRNLDRIKSQFEQNDLEFIYLTELNKTLNFDSPEQLEYFTYQYPYLIDEIKNLTQGKKFDSNLFLTEVLGLKEEELPCLCYRSGRYLKTFKVDSILSINSFLDETKDINIEGVNFSIKNRNPVEFDDGFNSNDFFETQMNEIAEDVISKIKRIKNPNAFKTLIDILSSQLGKSVESKLSRLNIDDEYRIKLVDYGDMEIHLTPLQKTVYLLFLNHPEGIAFSSLSEYKDELFSIYFMLSNRENIETLRLSIDELVNPLSNSLSEKCSRIRSAFLMNIDESLAYHYFIDGERGEKKFIKLSRELVVTQSINKVKVPY